MERIAITTTDYNKIFERTQNEMLLLNIVRASKRHPMYFTSFSMLRGNMSYLLGTGNLTVPFGRIGTGLNGAYSIAPNASLQMNPGFDLAVLDSQEFIAGLMTPVPIEIIDYYWQQGWPKQLLLHLFIERIEITNKKTKKTEVFDNYPVKGEFERFRNKLRSMDCDIGSETVFDAIGSEIEEKAAKDPKQLIAIQKAGLELKPVCGEEGDRACAENEKPKKYRLGSKRRNYSVKCKIGEETSKERTVMRMSGALSAKEGKETVTYEGKIYQRSPEAILYYLGEIVRAKTEQKFTPKIEICKRMEAGVCKEHDCVPLFLVEQDGSPRAASVAVDYEGRKYTIPESSLDNYEDRYSLHRSMHVLSLVSQLVGLQKKAQQLVPITGVVNVIGR
jgi:hypothetical protein